MQNESKYIVKKEIIFESTDERKILKITCKDSRILFLNSTGFSLKKLEMNSTKIVMEILSMKMDNLLISMTIDYTFILQKHHWKKRYNINHQIKTQFPNCHVSN
jgi:hypothetical protein